MNQFVDPFKSDTQRYKDLINKDSNYEFIDAEEVKDDENLISKSTVKGLPPSAFKAAQDAVNKLNANKEVKEKVATTFNKLFDDLNQKYGLSVKMNFDQYTNDLTYMIEPTNKKVAELYLSEAYGIFRVVLYNKFLQAIALLSSQILDPSYLLSESMTYSDKLDVMERLYQFMVMMNEIYKEVNIPNTPQKLEKVNETTGSKVSLNDPEVRKFMDQLFNKVTNN